MEYSLCFFLQTLRAEFLKQKRGETVFTIEHFLADHQFSTGPTFGHLQGFAEDLAESFEGEPPWERLSLEQAIDALFEWGYEEGRELRDYLVNGGLTESEAEVLMDWLGRVQEYYLDARRTWKQPIPKNE